MQKLANQTVQHQCCRMRPEGDNILSGAAHRNGGDYHNSAVNERVKMIKFAVTLLLLIPVAFSAAPPPYVDYNVSSLCVSMIWCLLVTWYRLSVCFGWVWCDGESLGVFQLESCEEFYVFSRNHFAKIPRNLGVSIRLFRSQIVCSFSI